MPAVLAFQAEDVAHDGFLQNKKTSSLRRGLCVVHVKGSSYLSRERIQRPAGGS
jgi:hypothetical protein